MPQFTNKTWLVLLVVLGIVLVLVLYSPSQNQVNAPAGEENVPSSTATLPSGAPSNVNPQTQSPKPAQQPPTSQISILSPIKSEQWAIATNHTVRWSKAAGVTGQVYLVSANTGQIVGWIHPSTGANQTSFDWNTRDITIGRTDPSRKDIGVGNYFIEMKFDSPKMLSARSGAFLILYAGEIKPVTHAIP